MSSGRQTPKSPKFRTHRSLLIASQASLSHPPDSVVNCRGNHQEDNPADSSPDYATDSPEHHVIDCLENRGEDNLPESLADNLDHCLKNHAADNSADCP